jgi:hypothetical protein
MKCRICEGVDFSGHCCITCWTQHCPDCGKITYSTEDYVDALECQCRRYETVDERLHLTIGYLDQVLNGIVSSFCGIFGVDLVELCLRGVLDNMENIRATHLSMGTKLCAGEGVSLGAKILGRRQLAVQGLIMPDRSAE